MSELCRIFYSNSWFRQWSRLEYFLSTTNSNKTNLSQSNILFHLIYSRSCPICRHPPYSELQCLSRAPLFFLRSGEDPVWIDDCNLEHSTPRRHPHEISFFFFFFGIFLILVSFERVGSLLVWEHKLYIISWLSSRSLIVRLRVVPRIGVVGINVSTTVTEVIIRSYSDCVTLLRLSRR